MQNGILQVTLLLENNQHFLNVRHNNEHLFKRIIILQFIILDVIRIN